MITTLINQGKFIRHKISSLSISRVMSSSLVKVSYVGQKDAQDVDNTLFNDYKYSVDQLMEIAGLCCAQVLATCYNPANGFARSGEVQGGNIAKEGRVLVVCGPGNNGGDGLAAARHLLAFGYKPEIFYPKRTNRPIFDILTTQCETLHIPFIKELPLSAEIDGRYSVILDAIFGFSFKGNVRSPFDRILEILRGCKTPICSVDIPSGWDVEKGNINGVGLDPQVLISLTCPKICAKEFHGRHFLGLRIIPEELAKKYNVILPVYPGIEQIVEL